MNRDQVRAADRTVRRAIWLILPVVLGGLGHVAVLKTNVLSRLALPIDGGARWRGRPVFGANKTWRGMAVMTGLTALASGMLDTFARRNRWERGLEVRQSARVNAWVSGAVCGLAYCSDRIAPGIDSGPRWPRKGFPSSTKVSPVGPNETRGGAPVASKAKTVTTPRAEASLYLGKAQQLAEEAGLALEGARHRAAMLNSIHAGISSADAVAVALAGRRSTDPDHQRAVDLLGELEGTRKELVSESSS